MFSKRAALLLFSIFLFSVSVYAAEDLPLAEPGPYAVGQMAMRFQDVPRDRQVINTSIWYPALAGASGNANEPDRSGAPYPLVLYSHGWGGSPAEAEDNGLAQALVSQGFVVVAMRHNTDNSYLGFIDRPLDTLFILNSLAALDEGDLVGMIDTDRVGVTGYSFGAHTAMVAGGARFSPPDIQAFLANPDDTTDLQDWNVFAEYAARFLELDGDNLWPAITDDRIQAVLPIAGADALLFGEAGTAAISKPVFIVAGTADELSPYSDMLQAFEYMGATDHYLLSLVREDHFFPLNPDIQRVLAHFAVAYFGYYLQDKAEYASYLSADYVSSLTNSDNLIWGVYSDE
jgi:predicted dienelactone hydrolase